MKVSGTSTVSDVVHHRGGKGRKDRDMQRRLKPPKNYTRHSDPVGVYTIATPALAVSGTANVKDGPFDTGKPFGSRSQKAARARPCPHKKTVPDRPHPLGSSHCI